MISPVDDNIIKIVNELRTNLEFDGAIFDGREYIPFNFLKTNEIVKIMEIWRIQEDAINNDMHEWIDDCCIENPDKNFVSSNWIPIAQFNGGSHLFAVIRKGKFTGTVLGILSSPYRVIKVAVNIDEFVKIGKLNLQHI